MSRKGKNKKNSNKVKKHNVKSSKIITRRAPGKNPDSISFEDWCRTLGLETGIKDLLCEEDPSDYEPDPELKLDFDNAQLPGVASFTTLVITEEFRNGADDEDLKLIWEPGGDSEDHSSRAGND